LAQEHLRVNTLSMWAAGSVTCGTRPAMGWRRLFCLLPVGFFFHGMDATKATNPNPSKFLIVSAPRDSRISYMKVRRGNKPVMDDETKMMDLINSGLVHPQGLAVDQKTGRLFVADPDMKSIFFYKLRSAQDGLHVGPQNVLVGDTESRWVTVDPTGNIFFTDEPRNQILKVSHTKSLRGNITPEVVLDGYSMAQVNAPGGVATDSFHTYWVNKQIGMQVGSVVRAPKAHERSSFVADVQTIARNTDKSYGICLALNNVFFTQPAATLYGVKKGGSTVVPISDRLTNPRGCAWDGDGTVYVADRGANAVYSFAGSMQALSAAQLSKTVDFQDAFGVAVYSKATRCWASSLLCMAAGLLAASHLAVGSF